MEVYVQLSFVSDDVSEVNEFSNVVQELINSYELNHLSSRLTVFKGVVLDDPFKDKR